MKTKEQIESELKNIERAIEWIRRWLKEGEMRNDIELKEEEENTEWEAKETEELSYKGDEK